ncbi:MAG: ATP-binding protein, partial [Oscillibacter sp.]|nr:ATP-binding protein [Oscillibacter sp.]
EKLRILNENGLSEAVQQEIPAFQAEKAGILRVFFDDFNEKYKVYAPLVEKLTLFRKILNRRFRTFKRVEISREYGLRVRDIRKDENGAEIAGEVIPPESLSSGEQETLVLYYQLIFETEPGTMLLIDEPEISLHIAWQRHFIDELKEIVRLNSLRAVVATHSASIIGRHRDIQIDLGALYQDELDRQHTKQGRPDQRNSAGSE